MTSYVLEARPIGKDKYIRLTKERLMDKRFTYDGLREGDTYEFRVSAVNEIGQGKPSFNTKPIICKDELGMRTSLIPRITLIMSIQKIINLVFIIAAKNVICLF